MENEKQIDYQGIVNALISRFDSEISLEEYEYDIKIISHYKINKTNYE